jgi:hypothetical protein
MTLYTLFISYRHGGHYCGVYPTLEIAHDVIKEMMRDMEIDKSETPKIGNIRDALVKKDDFWHEFTDSTWIHVQEVSEQNTERIVNFIGQKAVPLSEEGIIDDFVSKIARLSGDEPLDGDETAKIAHQLAEEIIKSHESDIQMAMIKAGRNIIRNVLQQRREVAG